MKEQKHKQKQKQNELTWEGKHLTVMNDSGDEDSQATNQVQANQERAEGQSLHCDEPPVRVQL